MIILQGERGSGKTSLLQDIAASFAGDYIDCSKLTEDIVRFVATFYRFACAQHSDHIPLMLYRPQPSRRLA